MGKLVQLRLLANLASKIYVSRPYPSGRGPVFYNRVVIIKTNMYALEILKCLKKIESIFGRRNLTRNSPRVLDLDLLDCRGEILNIGETLIIPHPRMHQRSFVLQPLQELNPKWIHPIKKKGLKELISNLNNKQKIFKISKK